MNKIRLSYTLINLWRRGKIDEAVAFYFHLPQATTSPDALRGLEFDKEVEMYVSNKKRLPDALGGLKMHNPQPKLKLVVPYNQLADLVAEYDVYDEPVIYEFKNSRVFNAGDYLNDFQLDFYFLVAIIKGLKIQRGVVYCYNIVEQDYSVAISYFTPKKVERAVNLVDTFLPEIYDFLSKKEVRKNGK